MISGEVKHIYYRGCLKSCNYQCSYCPFAKRPVNLKELEKDKEALNRFVGWVRKQQNTLSIMFVPYGEALVHTYYIKALAELSGMPNVTAISSQTNLSLNPQKFIELLKKESTDLHKINLWATFHDEMESIERFSEKVEYLSKYINISVGVVGTPQMVDSLRNFRILLPKSVYLWVNAMEGLNRKYTTEEIKHICSIDPLFRSELVNPKSDINRCCAGKESLFAVAEGDVYACNRSKIKLGNIYDTEELNKLDCKTRSCDCFLAYAHRSDMDDMNAFGSGRFLRIPKGINIDTIFFDIDDTLTNVDGIIDQSTVDAVKQISEKQRIYLATALPFTYAMRKCKAIRPYLSGGVFANGADIRDFGTKYRLTIPMSSIELGTNETINRLCYTQRGVLYKVAFIGKYEKIALLHQQLQNKQYEQYHIFFEDGVISITDKEATKLSGIIKLCSKLGVEHKKVMVVGNGENDMAMLQYFNHSVAVQSADEKVKKHASYSMNIDHLPLFL